MHYKEIHIRIICHGHWRRLGKNIGWANQNIGGQKVVKSDKYMGDSQLLGARARAAPLSLRLWSRFSTNWIRTSGGMTIMIRSYKCLHNHESVQAYIGMITTCIWIKTYSYDSGLV